MEIFDVRCSRCGGQLYFIETTDEEERGMIFATPCQNCMGAEPEKGLGHEVAYELQKEHLGRLVGRPRKAFGPAICGICEQTRA